MANQKEILDLVARIDGIDKRTERLESLEFGTVAFPSGEGLTCFEHHVTPPGGDGGHVFTIPQTHRHLLLTWSLSQISGDTGLTGLRITFNGAGPILGDYAVFKVDRYRGGIVAEGGAGHPWGDVAWVFPVASGDDIAPAPGTLIVDQFSSGWMFLQDYQVTGKFHQAHFQQGAYLGASSDPRAVQTGLLDSQGTGAFRLQVALTSMTVSTVFPAGLLPKSSMTLYGLCKTSDPEE